MSKISRILTILIASAGALGIGGCFTGVESTPRINDAEVKREKASGVSKEQLFLRDIKPTPPSKWAKNKAFKVSDSRIVRIFTPASSDASELVGKNIYFQGIAPARSLTGDDASEITFIDQNGNKYYYRLPGTDTLRINTLSSLEIPFTVDIEIVDKIGDAITGQNYYVRTPAWYNPVTGEKENGLRHVEVHIDSVLPGDSYFPATVCFSVVDESYRNRTGDGPHALYMSVGDSKAATRNFDVLFSFDNPRKTYPEIRDDVWALIVASKVREGMTRDECRLALGTPPEVMRTPTYAGMREVWSYSDGVFLIFEDGYLTRYRL